MALEYLESSIFTARWNWLAAFVKDYSFEGDVILDLNCGKFANLRFYLNQGFYIGTDIALERTEGVDRLYSLRDDEVLEFLKDERVDVILLFGDGAHEFTQEPLESATIGQSFTDLILHFKPRVVIHEMIQGFEDRYRLLTKRKEFMEENGYRVVAKSTLHMPGGDDWVSTRIAFVYQRI